MMLVPAVVAIVALQAGTSPRLDALAVGAIVGGALVLGIVVTLVLRRRATAAWLRQRTARRLAERRRVESGVLRAIVDADPGEVRIRGRVRTLRPVPAPGGDLVAAFRARRVEAEPGGRGRPEVVEVSACGRFVVDDGSGVAVVDDDAFTIEPLDVQVRGDVIAIRDGDLIEVVGPARREVTADDGALRLGDGETALVLDGRPDAPVLLVPLPLAASLAPPRSRAFGVPTRPGPHTLEHDALHEVEAGGRADAEARGPITR